MLRYESSALAENETTSLDEYVSRAGPEQTEIYYLCAPSREMALQSPYYEAFKYVYTMIQYPIEIFLDASIYIYSISGMLSL